MSKEKVHYIGLHQCAVLVLILAQTIKELRSFLVQVKSWVCTSYSTHRTPSRPSKLHWPHHREIVEIVMVEFLKCSRLFQIVTNTASCWKLFVFAAWERLDFQRSGNIASKMRIMQLLQGELRADGPGKRHHYRMTIKSFFSRRIR